MNPDKRQFFRNLKLRILLSEVLTRLAGRLPPDELAYEVEFKDPNRNTGGSSNNSSHNINPPLLPEEFSQYAADLNDRYEVNVSEDLVTIRTRVVTKVAQGVIAQEHAYSFSVLDIIDP